MHYTFQHLNMSLLAKKGNVPLVIKGNRHNKMSQQNAWFTPRKKMPKTHAETLRFLYAAYIRERCDQNESTDH